MFLKFKYSNIKVIYLSFYEFLWKIFMLNLPENGKRKNLLKIKAVEKFNGTILDLYRF